jgi:hypothetical protein
MRFSKHRKPAAFGDGYDPDYLSRSDRWEIFPGSTSLESEHEYECDNCGFTA